MPLPFGQHGTHSPQETFQLAHSIGQSIDSPTIFFLEGELGVGKTVFAKGIICGLGQPDPDDVPSPSFTLINEYSLKFKVYHIDLYRLGGPEDINTLDLDEIFAESAVVIVEWSEKLAGLRWNNVILVKILDFGDDRRQITISPWKGRNLNEA